MPIRASIFFYCRIFPIPYYIIISRPYSAHFNIINSENLIHPAVSVIGTILGICETISAVIIMIWRVIYTYIIRNYGVGKICIILLWWSPSSSYLSTRNRRRDSANNKHWRAEQTLFRNPDAVLPACAAMKLELHSPTTVCVMHIIPKYHLYTGVH